MGSRIEILNAGGFRSDGRKQLELRDFRIDLTPQPRADGAALVSHGLTQVLVSVLGPHEARSRAQTIHDRANINVEVSVASFSTGERRRRTRGDKRTLEFAALIKSTFEPVIQTNLYPRSQIDIFVQVLQQDGGTLHASVNATSLALAAAGIAVYDFVCAVNAGVHTTAPLLDLTTLEENDVPNVTVAVMPKTKKVTLVSMETRLHVDRFEEIFKLACEAGQVIHGEMKHAVKSRTAALVSAMEAGLPGGVGDGGRGGDSDNGMDET